MLSRNLASHLHLYPRLATCSWLDQREAQTVQPCPVLPGWLSWPVLRGAGVIASSSVQRDPSNRSKGCHHGVLSPAHLQANLHTLASRGLSTLGLEAIGDAQMVVADGLWWSLVVQMSGCDATMLPQSGMQFRGPPLPSWHPNPPETTQHPIIAMLQSGRINGSPVVAAGALSMSATRRRDFNTAGLPGLFPQ